MAMALSSLRATALARPLPEQPVRARQALQSCGAAVAASCDRRWASLARRSAREDAAGAVLGVAAAVGAVAAAAPGHRRAKKSRLRRCRTVRQAAFDAAAWRCGFRDVEELAEGYYFMDDISGLPEDLVGNYFCVGPGKFSVEGKMISHPSDGDGHVTAISFNGNGQVCVRQRFVQTQGFLRDKIGKRITTNGFFGTKATDNGNFLAAMKNYGTKNTANAGMMYLEDKLVALSHCGKPYIIDPGCLGTVLGSEDSGATDLGGYLDTADTGFSGTPRFCANTGTYLNFDQAPSALGTQVSLMEFAKGWRPRYKFPKRVNVGGCTLFADFGATQRWFILAKPPLRADTMGAAMGKLPIEVLESDAGGTAELIFSSRDRGGVSPGRGGGQEFTVPIDGLVCSQFANAYDLEDGRVVMDVVSAERWDLGRPDGERPLWETKDPSTVPRTQLVRYEANPKTEAWSKRVLFDGHVGCASVNPKVSGKPHRYVFCAVGHDTSAAGPMAGVAKVDVDSGEIDSWIPGPSEFICEPLFVGRGDDASAEDDGYLIAILLDGAAERSDVLVFDARQVSQGPISRFPLRGPLPHGSRGCWADGLTYTEDEMKRKQVLLKLFAKKSKAWNAMDAGFNTLAGGAFFQKQGTAMR